MNVSITYADDSRFRYSGIVTIHYMGHYMLLCRYIDDYRVFFHTKEHGELVLFEVYEDVKKR